MKLELQEECHPILEPPLALPIRSPIPTGGWSLELLFPPKP